MHPKDKTPDVAAIEKLQAEYDELAKQTTAVAPDATYNAPPSEKYIELRAKKKEAFQKLTEAQRAAEKREQEAARAAASPPPPPTVPDRLVGKPQGALPNQPPPVK